MTIELRRYDAIGALMRPHRRASDGALLAEGIASCEGILEYPRADGTVRRELVTRQAVIDTARTVARAPVTLLHPATGMVTADSAEALVVGDVDGETSVEEQAQGGYARVKIAVRRADALAAVNAGTHELSVGYVVTIDEAPGEHPMFGRYDASQVGRDVNHLAIVPRGRAGAGVSLRIDHDAVSSAPPRSQHMKPALVQLLSLLGIERVDSEDTALKEGVAALKSIQTDAAKHRADAQKYSDEFVTELEGKVKDAEESCKAMKADFEKLEGENAALKAEKEKGEKEEQDRKDAAELVRLRTLAEKRGVKLDAAATVKTASLAIAQSVVPGLRADASAEMIAGVLLVAEPTAPARSGYDFKTDAKPEAGAPDPFFDPYIARADAARAGGAK